MATVEEAIRSFLEPIITDIVNAKLAEAPVPTVALSLTTMRDALGTADSRSIRRFVDELDIESFVDERIDNVVDDKIDDRLDYKDYATKDEVDEKVDEKVSDLDLDIKHRVSELLDEEFNTRLKDALANATININVGG